MWKNAQLQPFVLTLLPSAGVSSHRAAACIVPRRILMGRIPPRICAQLRVPVGSPCPLLPIVRFPPRVSASS